MKDDIDRKVDTDRLGANSGSPSHVGRPSQFMKELTAIQKLLGPAVLLKCFGKRPVKKEWQKITLDDMTVEYIEALEGNNVGVLLGSASAGLISIDFDSDQALESFFEENPVLSRTLQTRGARGGNLWFRIRGDIPLSTRLADLDENRVGEWRANGNQTIVMGIHPDSRMPYAIVQRLKPILTSVDKIRWPREVTPMKWAPHTVVEENTCDVEHPEHTDNSSESLHPCNTACIQPYDSASLRHYESTPLHHTSDSERSLRAIEVDRLFAEMNPAGVVKLYKNLVKYRHKAVPHGRNAVITQMVPFLYHALSEDLVIKFSVHFYKSNQAIFNDTEEDHLKETVAMLNGVASSYLQVLSDAEREVYLALPEDLKPVFRICRDLANRDKNGSNAFFLSAQDLATRTESHCQQAHRRLRDLCQYLIITIATPGTQRSLGKRGTSTTYRWRLSEPVGVSK